MTADIRQIPVGAAAVDLHLDTGEVVAIIRAMDRWQIAEVPPGGDGWWTLQAKLKMAVAANPEAAAVIDGALDGR
jgi:hypothetical protein